MGLLGLFDSKRKFKRLIELSRSENLKINIVVVADFFRDRRGAIISSGHIMYIALPESEKLKDSTFEEIAKTVDSNFVIINVGDLITNALPNIFSKEELKSEGQKIINKLINSIYSDIEYLKNNHVKFSIYDMNRYNSFKF